MAQVDIGGGYLPLRILIADDYADLREMLNALLQTHRGWQVCGEASNGLEAVQKAAELKPDLIILDVSMPEIDGLQAARQISATLPEIRILIYTNYSLSPQVKLEAMKYGAHEVINKYSGPEELIRAVESLDKRPLPPIVETPTAVPDLPEPDMKSGRGQA
jgi:DNA-binding NarL/FixJ family response regulator